MRLIDADAIPYTLHRWKDYGGKINEHIIALKDCVDEIPTIDPVKHGRWVCTPDGINQCSKCGAEYLSEDKFCGECGARMDGTK